MNQSIARRRRRRGAPGRDGKEQCETPSKEKEDGGEEEEDYTER